MSFLLSWVADFWEWIAPWFSSKPGSGAMRAAAFIRYPGANSLGHVGWAFDYSAADVNAGSVENPSGAATQVPSKMDYWDQMLTNPMPTMTAHSYDSLKYVNLVHANPFKAYRVAQWIGTVNYDVLGRNCMDDAYDVLRAYGIPELPLPSEDLLPNVWFDALEGAFANVAAFQWNNLGERGLADRIGLSLLKNAEPKAPTWRRPGHRDYKNFQAQIVARRGDAGESKS